MSTEGVDKGHHQWLQAMETNDPAALGRLVTAEVVLMPPHSEAVVGRQGVVDWFAGVVAQARTKAVGVPRREVMLAGDLAIERGPCRNALARVRQLVANRFNDRIMRVNPGHGGQRRHLKDLVHGRK